MDTVVFLAVLAAAVMHASWNAIIKIGLDRFATVMLLVAVQALIAVPVVPFLPWPHAASLPYVVASAVLHAGYKLFLIHAYRHGDLAQIYPLARGGAPLIVALVSAAVIGEAVGANGMMAVLLVAVGILVLAAKGGADLRRMSGKAFAYAIGTACFTASYTIVDGMGARLAGSPSSFILWGTILDAVFMLLYGWTQRGAALLPRTASAWRLGLIAGAMSLGSYWIAVWAFAQAPIALVAALRETSVLFAMLISVAFLGERGTAWRWSAAASIVAGVVLIRL